MKNAAIYARVSSEKQTAENQIRALRKLAAARSLHVVETIEETISGAKRRRPGLDRLLQGAHRGDFRVVLVWSIDRLGRSMHSTIGTVLELDQAGVQVISRQESWLQMQGPVRPLLLAIFAWVAEQERATLIERTNAGLARARAAGKRLGRPTVAVDVDEALRLRKRYSIRSVAKQLGVSPATLHRALVAASAR